MASDPAIHQKYLLPFLPYSRGKPVSEEQFYALKKDLIDAVLRIDENGNSFLRGNSVLSESFKTLVLNDDAREKIKLYFENITTNTRKAAFVAISDERIKDVVSVLAEELNVILPITINKKINDHYGPLPKPVPPKGEQTNHYQNLLGEYMMSRYVSIPYHNGIPAPESRHSHPLEAANFTIQKDLGLEQYQAYVKLALDQLKRLGVANLNFKSRYQNLAKQHATTNIYNLTDEQVDNITINLSIDEKMQLTNNFALSTLNMFETQIYTSTQIYEFLSKFIDAFSGMLWNEETYPHIFSLAKLSNTTPYTILLLLSFESEVKALDRGSLTHLVEQIYKDWSNPGSFIDQAGLFLGYPNKDVAKEMLRYAKGGVIFYDESDNIVIMEKNGVVVPLSRTNVPINDQIAFWSRPHTTGSNLKLAKGMKAKMSIDKHTLMRDWAQSAWRLRGLDASQSILQYVAFKDDLNFIRQKTSHSYGLSFDPSQVVDLICYAILQQKELLDLHKWRAFEHRLRNGLAASVFTHLSQEINVAKKRSIFQQSKGLFSLQQPKQFYTIYGLPTDVVNKKDAVDEKISLLKNEPSYSIYNLENAIDKKWQVLKDHAYDHLPERVLMIHSPLQGTEVQIQLNLQLQTQTQTQNQIIEMSPSKRSPSSEVKKWNLAEIREHVFRSAFFAYNPLLVTNTDAANYSSRLAPLFQELSKDIYFSKNFAPINDDNFSFFDQHGKQAAEVLVIYDRRSNRHQMIVLDLDDVQEWKSFLLNDQEKNLNKRDHILIIYNILDNKISAQSYPAMNEITLKEDQTFKLLVVQAKFIGGIINYNQDETQILKRWLRSSKDINALKDIFKSLILAYKDDTLKDYYSSVIADIFNETF